MRGKIRVRVLGPYQKLDELAIAIADKCNEIESDVKYTGDVVISASHSAHIKTTPWSEYEVYTGIVTYREGTR